MAKMFYRIHPGTVLTPGCTLSRSMRPDLDETLTFVERSFFDDEEHYGDPCYVCKDHLGHTEAVSQEQILKMYFSA